MSRTHRDGSSAPLWLLLVILVLLGVGATFLLWPGADHPESALDAAGAASSATASSVLAVNRPNPEPQAGGRVIAGAEPEVDGPAVSATLPARVVGRVVDDTGAAAAATLTLRPVQAAVPIAADRFATAADGAFAVDLPPLLAVELEVRAPGFAAVVAPIGRTPAGQELRLGTVHLGRGRRVVGRVLDQDGVPVDDVAVAARRDVMGSELKLLVRPVRAAQARTGLGGGFAFADPLPPGKWSIDVAGRTLHVDEKAGKASRVGRFVVEAMSQDLVLELVVKPVDVAQFVAGTVRDDAGQSVPGAQVTAFGADDKRLATANADADGRFELQLGSAAPDLRVRLRAQLTGYEGDLSPETFAPGTRDARVFLRRGAELAVHVVDASGSPVERFALHVFPVDCRNPAELRARSDGRHDGGVALAHGLPNGDYAVLVQTPLGHLIQPGVQRARLHGVAARVDVEVAAPVHRRVRALKHGQPADAVSVELLSLLDSDAVHAVHADMPASKLLDLWKLERPRALRVVSGLTDARGEVALAGHPTQRYWLRLRSPGGVATLREVVLGSEPEVIEVAMAVGCVVAGALQPAEFVKQVRSGAPRLLLLGKTGEFERRRDTLRPLAEDGKFVFTDVPAGDWLLRLEWTQTGVQVGGRDSWGGPDGARASTAAAGWTPKGWPDPVTRTHDLLPVQGLIDGERRQVVAAVQHLLHAELSVEISQDGKPWLGGVWFVEQGVAGRKPYEFLARSKQGQVTLLLPAGTWRCEVVGHATPRQRVGDLVTVVSGQKANARLVVDLQHVRLRVVDAAGAPARKVALTVARDAGAPLRLDETDAKGEVAVMLAPGRYRAEHGQQELGALDVPSRDVVELKLAK